MKINLSFDHSYGVEILEEIPIGYDIHYFPSKENYGKDGLILRITPDYQVPWIGVFAFGDISKNGYSAIFSMPDKERLCIISNGAGYIINVYDLADFEELKVIPVKVVIPILSKGLIIFGDYTKLVAYSSKGVAWVTKQLSLDGFEIIGTSDLHIKGKYLDIRIEKDNVFTVDLSTGYSENTIE